MTTEQKLKILIQEVQEARNCKDLASTQDRLDYALNVIEEGDYVPEPPDEDDDPWLVLFRSHRIIDAQIREVDPPW